MAMLLNRNKDFKNNTAIFPSTTLKLDIFICVMPFHLMSDLKSFLQDKSIIYWLAILLEETIAHQGSVSLPHW